MCACRSLNSHPEHPVHPLKKGCSGFPRYGRFFWLSSTLWKIFLTFFHAMEDFFAILPRYGRFWADSSTLWKIFLSFFHAMEDFFAILPRYGRFSSTEWKTGTTPLPPGEHPRPTSPFRAFFRQRRTGASFVVYPLFSGHKKPRPENPAGGSRQRRTNYARRRRRAITSAPKPNRLIVAGSGITVVPWKPPFSVSKIKSCAALPEAQPVSSVISGLSK